MSEARWQRMRTAASDLGISTETLARWITRYGIRSTLTGRLRFVDRDHLDEVMARGVAEKTEETDHEAK